MANTKKTGTYKGKSNKLGQGGRAQQMKDQAAPGQKNHHKGRKSKGKC